MISRKQMIRSFARSDNASFVSQDSSFISNGTFISQDTNEFEIQIEDEKNQVSTKQQKNSNTCCVCDTKFGKLFSAKRHQCEFWDNPVCAKHSKLRDFSGQKQRRICDDCGSKLQEKELRKKVGRKLEKIRVEDAEISAQLSTEQKTAHERQREVDRLQDQIREQEIKIKQMEERQKSKLKYEQDRYNNSQQKIDDIQQNITETNENEQKLTQELKDIDKELRGKKANLGEIDNRRHSVESEFQYFQTQLKGLVPLEQTSKLCCRDCRFKLRELYSAQAESFMNHLSYRQSTKYGTQVDGQDKACCLLM